MPDANGVQDLTALSVAQLRKMVGPDVHRPGSARARLVAEQIPVWALIGYIGAVAGTTDPGSITVDVIDRVAIDYDIAREAVLAALIYYGEHHAAIDALLEANAAAIA